MKEMKGMKKMMVIGDGCPNCGLDMDEMLHYLWDANLQRPEIQPDIKNGRNLFAPFGAAKCEGCGHTISIQLYGDLEGFMSFLFQSEQDRVFFADKILKKMIDKGVGPKACCSAIDQLISEGKIPLKLGKEMQMEKMGNPTLPKCRKCGEVFYDENDTANLAERLISQYKQEGFWNKCAVHSCSMVCNHCGVQTFVTLAFARDGDRKTWTCGWIGEGFASEEERRKEFENAFGPSAEGDVLIPDNRDVKKVDGRPLIMPAYVQDAKA